MQRELIERGQEPETRTIAPHLPRRVMVNLTAFIETKLDEQVPDLAKALRALDDNWRTEEWALELRATALVIADLIDQGWSVIPDGSRVLLSPPGLRTRSETVEQAKDRLRKSLQVGRERQLMTPSVHRFVDRLSRVATNNGQKSSALDLVDRGADLADLLRPLAGLPRDVALERLKGIIDPQIEVCDEATRCTETGIRLLDLWRYFRHTWSLEYRSMPGRQVPLLIRNRARPGRPVMGIAMLASPVLRTKPRDQWIGWTPAAFFARLSDGTWDAKDAVRALVDRIDSSIAEIRWDDLVTPGEIAAPTERVVFRLEQKGAGAALARERQLQDQYTEAMGERGSARSQTDATRRGAKDIDWMLASEDLLFIRKRSDTLARLLDAKQCFNQIDWGQAGGDILTWLSSTHGQRAIGIALQEVRKAGLSSQVADLSVCGAVAPYNVLLGGKLVALAMVSQEVSDIWRDRYAEQISIISSQMAGKPLRRAANLKILTTTSLYGSGSSQYNRLRLRASDHPNIGMDIAWQELDKTAGYGTVHLSMATVRILRELSEVQHQARRINNRFGEGTSPRLRQVREGLDVLGIASDDILHHATPRLFYGCSLSPSARDELMGLAREEPGPARPLEGISEAWRSRWLLARISNPDVLARLARLGPTTIKNDLLPVDASGQFLFPFEE
jgi:hypothetical protein